LIYIKLNSLKVTEGADCVPEKACLDGTRLLALNSLRTWIHGGGDRADARLVLLLGQAGVGKSAIAHSIAYEFKKAGRLGGSFCFAKDRGTSNFFRTIARGLADVDITYGSALASAMTSANSTTVSHSTQITELLLEPLQSLALLGPLVIVVDALDECAYERDEIVGVLAKNIHRFPSNIRFLVTSRPSEAEILRRYDWVKVYDLRDEPATQQDILAFVKDQLREPGSATRLKGFRSKDLEAIATSAENLFQYAAVVCREILGARENYEAPTKVFQRLMGPARSGLDSLYTLILTNAYGIHSSLERMETFRSVLGWILVARERLTYQALIDFGACSLIAEDADESSTSSDASSEYQSEEGFDTVSSILSPLGALLSGTQDPFATVYTLHSSFRDFLLDETRSGPFYIGPETKHHALLALASLKIMDRDLRFNIANLESSYVANENIPDLPTRLEACISKALRYACRNWFRHLKDSGLDENQFGAVSLISVIAGEKFLFWLEILGLLKCTYRGHLAFEFLTGWFKV